MTIDEKYEHLKAALSAAGGALVAFSGGVDSTFLAKVAFDVLGERALAVTIRSSIVPAFELDEAGQIARSIGIRHRFIDARVLDVEGFAENTPDRCYICKRALLSMLVGLAREEGLPGVVEGSNVSDASDYRPGMKAVEELGVGSPLVEAGLAKGEIRDLSRRLGLSTFDKPSNACLASRIPYGNRVTAEKLRTVENAEDFLRQRGYRTLRVRHHGRIARIELSPEETGRFLAEEDLAEIARHIKGFGFTYVTLDLEGYRTGSLNEPL